MQQTKLELMKMQLLTFKSSLEEFALKYRRAWARRAGRGTLPRQGCAQRRWRLCPHREFAAH